MGVNQILVADNKHPLRQTGRSLLGALDSFNDQCAGGSAEELFFAESVDMRVIPVETRWLVLRNLKAILEGCIPWLHRGLHHIILMADGRNGEAVKVEIGGHRAHHSTGAGIRGSVNMRVRRHRPAAS